MLKQIDAEIASDCHCVGMDYVLVEKSEILIVGLHLGLVLLFD